MTKIYKGILNFWPIEFWCMGNRIIDIINIVKKWGKNYHWYIGDIITNQWYVNERIKDATYYIGESDNLLSLIQPDIQYIWGVFVATEKKLTTTFTLFAENNKEMQIRESVLELRAFDSSYFEIYTTEHAIYARLEKHFKKNLT